MHDSGTSTSFPDTFGTDSCQMCSNIDIDNNDDDQSGNAQSLNSDVNLQTRKQHGASPRENEVHLPSAAATQCTSTVDRKATLSLPSIPNQTKPEVSQDGSESSSLDQEASRLAVLRSYLGILDCDHGNRFERLTALACRIFGVPMAMVTIADMDKQYCLSSRGVDYSIMRKSPFFSHTNFADSEILVVEDAASDSRFATDPQVTGYPNVRLYAGAPLVCPEGHRLGTLCVMDSIPRMAKVSLDEKQSLMELAAMAMEALLDLLDKKQAALKDPSHQIACTAHDLLTPLTGIALSLSCLKEDKPLLKKLSDQQRDMIETAANCSSVMNDICQKTMAAFRHEAKNPKESTAAKLRNNKTIIGPATVKVDDLVEKVNMVMAPIPKNTPIIISVDSKVPPVFVSDDMIIFRSAINLLTNACAKTESGSIHLRIFKRKMSDEQDSDEVVFECEDTGVGVDVANYPSLFKPVHQELYPRESNASNVGSTPPLKAGLPHTGLGLYSVATQIASIGGKYGFRPHSTGCTGAVFWFSVPVVLPSTLSNGKERNKLSDEVLKKARLYGLLGSKMSKVRDPSKLKGSTKPGIRKISSEDAVEALHTRPKNAPFKNKSSANASLATQRRKQVLVIEDSLVVRKSLARVLTNLGCDVTQATNGMQGLKQLKASLFDLVLCDFLMPVMDGLDCIQQYRNWEKANRPYFQQFVVGISAHASDKDVEQAFKIGMNDFRLKPVTYKQLQELKDSKEFKRKSDQLDQLGQEIQAMTRRRVDSNSSLASSAMSTSSSHRRFCLVVAGSSVITKLTKIASERIGWEIVSANNAESALGLLQMRNWDAVLVDDELGFSQSIVRFREWEQANRVNRQQNIITISASYALSQKNGNSFQLPSGFDGALGKPVEINALRSFLENTNSDCSIVTR